MPSSDPATEARSGRGEGGWRGALPVGIATLAICLALVAARIAWFDAYWLFRETPPWLGVTGGANRVLDRQTRRAKVLQALDRRYTIALVGSSTVYHGLDPADADPAVSGAIFNAGISALMGSELPIVASIVASRARVGRVVVGLDYYMFSRRGGPQPVSAALATTLGRANAELGSLLSLDALDDSWPDRVEGGDDPGSWTRSGFRITPPLSPDLTRRNDAVRRRTTAAYRPELMRDLDTALRRLSPREVDVYLSPVSPAQRRVMAELGLLDDFARWRADAARIAEARGARFHDLVDLALDEPFDPALGSTPAWLDNLHYTPLIGRRVLEAVGLRTAAASRKG